MGAPSSMVGPEALDEGTGDHDTVTGYGENAD